MGVPRKDAEMTAAAKVLPPLAAVINYFMIIIFFVNLRPSTTSW